MRIVQVFPETSTAGDVEMVNQAVAARYVRLGEQVLRERQEAP